jgi:hypothetical protein
MAPKKFTYTPGTGGGARTKALTAQGKASKSSPTKKRPTRFNMKDTKNNDAFGSFAKDVKDVLSYKGTIDPAKRNQTTSMEDRRKAMAMGQAAVAKNAGRSTIGKDDVVVSVGPLKINLGKNPSARGKKAFKELVGVDLDNPTAGSVGMAAASALPMGRIARLAKGVSEAAQAGKAAQAVASTTKAGTKASGIKPIEGFARTTVRKPVQTQASVNKQRRASLEKIAAKTGEPRTKIGAEQVKVAPKQGPKKSPPTVPPTKGVAIKTDDTPKIGSAPRAPRAIPEEYRATRPTDVAGETIKPFDAPRPKYQQFKVDGKYGDAEKAKFKAAVKEWNRKSRAAEKKATNAPAEQRTGTPLEKMREDVSRARFREAKGDFYKAGKQEGSTEARIQSTALKEEAAVDRARGAEYAQMLKETPGGVAPERPPVRYPNEGTRGGKTYDTRKSKFTTRPAKVRVAPKRADFATDAKYQSAKNKYDKAIAEARAKADVKQQSVKPGTDTPTDRPSNVAPSIAPKAPSRKGGFKETGSRFRLEGKTGKAGEPEMTKRPKLTEEAYVGEESIKASKQFQGIRPGKEVPEYRNVIDNLPDAKPAPKAKAPSAKAPAAKSKSKAKTETKAKEEAPEATPESAPARPAAMKSPTKDGASKTKFRPGMKAPSKSASPTPAASTPKKPSAKKEKVEDAKPVEATKAETPAAPTPKAPRASKSKPAETKPAEQAPEVKAEAKPSPRGKKQKPPTAAETASKVFQKRPPKSERAKARAAKREAKGPGPIKRFGQTKPMRIAKTGAATVAAVSGVGALAVGGTRKPVSTTKAKGTYQAGANDGRLSKLTIRKAQAERAAAAAEQPKKRFGAAGESKFLKGRSAVRQSVIDQINKQGMAKSLAAVKSRRNDPEYLEAIRRYYGAKRLKQALEG